MIFSLGQQVFVAGVVGRYGALPKRHYEPDIIKAEFLLTEGVKSAVIEIRGLSTEVIIYDRMLICETYEQAEEIAKQQCKELNG